LNGRGPGVGNPGTHPVTHPDGNKGKPETVATPKAFNKPRGNRPTKMICWQCGLPGHLKRNCVHPIPQPTSLGAQSNPGAVLCRSKGKDTRTKTLGTFTCD